MKKRRWLMVALIPLLAALLVVRGPAEQAEAFAGDAAVVVSTAGAVTTAGTATLCVSVIVCGIAAVGTVAVAYAGYRFLRAVWGSGKVIEQDEILPPSGTTTYGQGCWYYQLTTTDSNCAGSSGYTWPEDSAAVTISGNIYRATITSAGAKGSLNVVEATLEWSGGLVPSGGKFPVDLRGGSTGATVCATSEAGDAMASSGLTAGAITIHFDASACSAAGGLFSINFAGNFTSISQNCSGNACIGIYLFKGTPTPIQTVTAPQHKWRSVKTCTPTAGGDDVILTTYSALFREADAQLPPFPNPDCPAGYVPTEWEVFEGDETGADGDSMFEWTAPAPETMTEYSDCVAGGSAYPCRVTVVKSSPGGTWTECNGTNDCTSFDPDTSLDTEYQCRWGVHVMPLTDCAGIQVKTNPQTTTTIPGTETPTQTMQDILGPPVDPEFAVPPSPSDSNGDCFPSGWGLMNPVEWVLKPVKCALVWAFVPTTSLATMTASLSDAYSGTLVETGVDMVSEIGGAVPAFTAASTGGDCHGPGITVPVVGGDGVLVYPADACDGAPEEWATIVRTILSLMTLLGGGFTVVRLLTGVFEAPTIDGTAQ